MKPEPDTTRATLKALPDRPEFVPRGYEFLPDAFKRDVKPHGTRGRDHVLNALAEGDIRAFLLTHLGHWEPIPLRMWRKSPRSRKVVRRLHDGRMRMGLFDYDGPYLVGWVCVRKGVLLKVVKGILVAKEKGPQKGTFSPEKLEKTYRAYVKKMLAAGQYSSQKEDREAISHALGVTIPHRDIRRIRTAFAPAGWKLPGRRPKNSRQK